METIQHFAELHRVKTKRDECGDTIIPGKTGHIADGFVAGFGICAMESTRKRWGNVRRKLETAGFLVRQDADTEGVATFDPANKQQARLALRLIRVKTRRQMVAPSPAQLAVRARFARNSRLSRSLPEQAGM
jgi:hypothetical protein